MNVIDELFKANGIEEEPIDPKTLTDEEIMQLRLVGLGTETTEAIIAEVDRRIAAKEWTIYNNTCQ